MKKIVFLLFLIHIAGCSLARAANIRELIFIEKNAAGVNEVIYRDEHLEMVLGELKTFPKGTRFYHWEKATSSQIKTWNAEGKISAERIANLRKTNGFSGGGYYVSLSPLDSINYGNTAVIVELPKDITIMKVTYSNYANWDAVILALQERGVSAVSVRHTQTWFNFFDIEALSKIHVGTEKDFVNLKITTYEEPWSYKKLFKLFPGLENVESLKASQAKMESIYKGLKKPNEEVRLAVEEIAKNSSMNLVMDVFKKVSVENVSMKAITYAMEGIRYTSEKYVFKSIASDPNKMKHAFIEAIRSDSQYIHGPAIRILAETSMDISERTWILQRAQELMINSPKYQFNNLVEYYKKTPGQWLPHPLCRAVFN